MKTLLSSIILLVSTTVHSQHGGHMNNWYFGEQTAINFTNGVPAEMFNSVMNSNEGCATISDENGDLLFYTNGGGMPNASNIGGVWNRNHELMPNGSLDSLIGCNSAVQSSIILQKSSSEYYLFTVGCSEIESYLSYSIIDMNMEGGLGDISLKGQSLPGFQDSLITESVTATRHGNGEDYWLIVHAKNKTVYYVFEINSTGISAPIITNIGNVTYGNGELKISTQGDKMSYKYEVYDFDNATGVISNPHTLSSGGWFREFSPSGQFLYCGSPNLFSPGIFQYDLWATDINSSIALIDSSLALVGGMQIGPDKKIYVSLGGHLDVINNPDDQGLSCNYVQDQILLSGTGTSGLPNFVNSDLGTIGIEEQFYHQNSKEIIQIIDLLGRRVDFKTNTLQIYLYSDGTMEKVFRIE